MRPSTPWSAFVLFNVPDLDAALSSARAMLRPGGAIGLTSWADSEGSDGTRVFAEELDAAGAAPGATTMPAREELQNEASMPTRSLTPASSTW